MIYGHTEGLALDVPERDFDRADRRQRGTAARLAGGAFEEVVVERFDRQRVLADEQLFELAVQHVDNSAYRVGFGQAVEAFVGRDADVDPGIRALDDGGFDCEIKLVSRGVNVLNEQLDNSDAAFKVKSGDEGADSEVEAWPTLDEFSSILDIVLSKFINSSLSASSKNEK